MKHASASKPYAKKSLGQNFLVDPAYVAKIVSALEIKAGDKIIEIGPGRGSLTEKLIESEADIIALELDRQLVPQLAEKFSQHKNFMVLEADALEIDFAQIISRDPGSKIQNPGSKLIANLPYYISTAILQRLIEQRSVFSLMVLMFQREVVERIIAKPGNSARGFLTVLAEAFFDVEKLFDVPPEAFRPAPKIWSSVVRITPKATEISHEALFRELISTAFGQKRKTILNNLKTRYPNASETLGAVGIDPKRRPEALTLSEWKGLSARIQETR